MEIKTLGDHVRKRRLDLGLTQQAVADRLDVAKDTIRTWERNRHPPALAHTPAVIVFLGYVPYREPTNLAERLIFYRRLNGISRRELAHRLGADETTVWRWEAGRGRPSFRFQRELARWLAD